MQGHFIKNFIKKKLPLIHDIFKIACQTYQTKRGSTKKTSKRNRIPGLEKKWQKFIENIQIKKQRFVGNRRILRSQTPQFVH